MPKILIDSCSLLSLLLDEAEADKMTNWLQKARTGEVKLYMSLINYGEVCIKLDQFLDELSAEEAKENIKSNLFITILDVDMAIIESASKIKSGGGLAYPDAIALATCKTHDLTLLTKDSEFKKFTKDFEILFL